MVKYRKNAKVDTKKILTVVDWHRPHFPVENDWVSKDGAWVTKST